MNYQEKVSYNAEVIKKLNVRKSYMINSSYYTCG